jgi:TDG/mug DNA glycosylase family protein
MEPILPDVLQPDLKVVFCGTAASNKSAQLRAYYAGPGNYFWRTLYRIGLTPYQLEPHEFRRVLDYGIGLTNIVRYASGMDNQLVKADFDAHILRANILQMSPKVLAFNGKKAAQEFFSQQIIEYGQQPTFVGKTAVFVLPSTSGAARGFWNETYWYELADSLGH